MRNFFVIGSFAAILFVSCKKDRYCNCIITRDGTTTTYTQNAGFPPLLPSTTDTSVTPFHNVSTISSKHENVTADAMSSMCASHSEETINEASTSNVAGIYTVTTSDSGKKTSDCTID